jgi:hypothetical protein
VLSDEKRRALYDAGMYDPLDDDQEDVEVSNTHPIPMALGRELLDLSGSPANHVFCVFQGFHDFLQEIMSFMATVGREVTSSFSCHCHLTFTGKVPNFV